MSCLKICVCVGGVVFGSLCSKHVASFVRGAFAIAVKVAIAMKAAITMKVAIAVKDAVKVG